MSQSRYQICSTALVMAGANLITDFSGSSTESAVAAQLWETTVEAWLSMYDWRFAMVQEQLSLLADAPLSGWSYAYQIPGAVLKIRRVTCADVPIDYTRYNDKLFCDYSSGTPLYIDYTYNVDETAWPPYFRAVIEAELAGKFAFSVAAQTKLSEAYKAERERLFKLAKTIDAQSQPAKKLNLRHANSLIGRR